MIDIEKIKRLIQSLEGLPILNFCMDYYSECAMGYASRLFNYESTIDNIYIAAEKIFGMSREQSYPLFTPALPEYNKLRIESGYLPYKGGYNKTDQKTCAANLKTFLKNYDKTHTVPSRKS